MEKKEILDNQKSDPRPVGRWIIYIDKCTGCGVFDNSSSKICLLGFEQALHKNRKRNR